MNKPDTRPSAKIAQDILGYHTSEDENFTFNDELRCPTQIQGCEKDRLRAEQELWYGDSQILLKSNKLHTALQNIIGGNVNDIKGAIEPSLLVMETIAKSWKSMAETNRQDAQNGGSWIDIMGGIGRAARFSNRSEERVLAEAREEAVADEVRVFYKFDDCAKRCKHIQNELRILAKALNEEHPELNIKLIEPGEHHREPGGLGI